VICDALMAAYSEACEEGQKHRGGTERTVTKWLMPSRSRLGARA